MEVRDLPEPPERWSRLSGPGVVAAGVGIANFERSDHGVSVAHEADPTPDEQFMFVTDERGGGVVAPGSSCTPGIENPYGNGGAHAFGISDPTNIRYATTPAVSARSTSATRSCRRPRSATST